MGQVITLPSLVLTERCKKVVSVAPEVGCDYFWWIHPKDSLVYAEGRMCNDLREGWWIFDHIDGECYRIAGRFSGGLRSGLWQCIDVDGLVLVEGEFVADQVTGFWRYFADDGRIKTEGWYVDGIKEGWWIEYLTDGLLIRGEYSGNQKVGIWENRKNTQVVSVEDMGM